MFCATAKLLLMVELKVNQAIDETESLGTPVSVEAGGVEKCSPVVWEKIRRSADYKVHVIDELNEYNTETYPLPYIKTTSQKETDDKNFSNIDSSIAYWNTALDKKTQDACTMNIRPSFFKLLDQSKGWKTPRLYSERNLRKSWKTWSDFWLTKMANFCTLKPKLNSEKDTMQS